MILVSNTAWKILLFCHQSNFGMSFALERLQAIDYGRLILALSGAVIPLRQLVLRRQLFMKLLPRYRPSFMQVKFMKIFYFFFDRRFISKLL